MRGLFAAVGVAAALAGTALWLAMRPPSPGMTGTAVPGALMAATFKDLDGRSRSLGEFQGKVVVLNFWATWCAPCREEMPGFQRLQAEWRDRGVQFVGVSSEDANRVAAFARGLGVTYPLWVGGDEVGEMSRRLGNRLGVLPHTVVLDRGGASATARVGAYPEAELDALLARTTAIVPPK
ncbi:MAG TPA: TlpA disulfide reductase family protein [Usitatibacter sp.]|nr:TlpA disulfide reductase family protein [Usitatibacter sp.]